MEKIEKNQKLGSVNIETVCLACVIPQLATLLDGVWNNCCSWSAQGVLCGGSSEKVGYSKEAENAREWILEHYTSVAGAIGVAREIAEMLSAVVIDYDITITK